MTENLGNYAPTAGHTPDADLTGYHVEAPDGRAGTVDENSTEIGSGYLVVDTGPWIFGKKVLLPAGAVLGISNADRTVRVALSREQVKAAPEFDEDRHLGDPRHRDQLSSRHSRGH